MRFRLEHHWHLVTTLVAVFGGELLVPLVTEKLVHNTIEQFWIASAFHIGIAAVGLALAGYFLFTIRPDLGELVGHANRVRAATGEGKVYKAVLEFFRPGLRDHFLAVEKLFDTGITIEGKDLWVLTAAART